MNIFLIIKFLCSLNYTYVVGFSVRLFEEMRGWYFENRSVNMHIQFLKLLSIGEFNTHHYACIHRSSYSFISPFMLSVVCNGEPFAINRAQIHNIGS